MKTTLAGDLGFEIQEEDKLNTKGKGTRACNVRNTSPGEGAMRDVAVQET
jgi:hypothetical protein